jgi:hypothetical protein
MGCLEVPLLLAVVPLTSRTIPETHSAWQWWKKRRDNGWRQMKDERVRNPLKHVRAHTLSLSHTHTHMHYTTTHHWDEIKIINSIVRAPHQQHSKSNVQCLPGEPDWLRCGSKRQPGI